MTQRPDPTGDRAATQHVVLGRVRGRGARGRRGVGERVPLGAVRVPAAAAAQLARRSVAARPRRAARACPRASQAAPRHAYY